jgi:pyruvate formate lyase activating enzyme
VNTSFPAFIATLFAYNRTMDFSGWEKLSLVDFDDKITTTLFTAGCNFRCPFCHNSELVLHPKDAPTIPWSDIMDYLRKRRGVIDAVCVTGGEPTLMPDLFEKLADIKSLGYMVKLDSNGSHPQILREAISKKLVDYVAMDIKNSLPKYAMTIGTVNIDLDKIQESTSLLLEGQVRYEFRTTIIKEYHNENDFEAISAWLEGAEKYYLQRYIDSENCISHGLTMVSKEKALIFKAILEKRIKFVGLRSYD